MQNILLLPLFVLLILLQSTFVAPADVLYSTGFDTVIGKETWTVGNDKIVGFNSWTGTSLTTLGVNGTGRTGIDPESVHGVPGLNNAGFMGSVTSTVTFAGNNLNVRRPLVLTVPNYYAPVSAEKEVVLITALVGIKDSAATPPFTLRDNFELFVTNGSNLVLAAVRFDNTTLDLQGAPRQLMLRTNSTPGSTALSYVATGGYYIYDTIQLLALRINFRTNKWSAYLDGIPLFNDLPFYVGSGTLNLGAVGFRMFFGQAIGPILGNYTCTGGSNYLLFDDLSVQADVPAAVAFSTPTKPNSSSCKLTWNAEAAYRYSVYSSTDLASWSLLTPAALTASFTTALSYTDTTTTGVLNRFYKVSRIYP